MLLLLNARVEYNKYKREVQEMNNSRGLKFKAINKGEATYYYYYIKERRTPEEVEQCKRKKAVGKFKGDVNFKDRYYGKVPPKEFRKDKIMDIIEAEGVWQGNHLMVSRAGHMAMMMEHAEFAETETILLDDAFNEYLNKTTLLEESTHE